MDNKADRVMGDGMGNKESEPLVEIPLEDCEFLTEPDGKISVTVSGESAKAIKKIVDEEKPNASRRADGYSCGIRWE